MANTNISQVHDWVNFLLNKAQGDYFSPQEIDNALHRAQMSYFNQLYSMYASSEKLQDALSPFKVTMNFLTSDTPNGVLTMPNNYQYLLGDHTTVVDAGNTKYRPLEIYAEDKISFRLNSQLRPVSVNKPIGQIAGKVSGQTVIQLYPKTPMAGTVYYLKAPTPPVFGFTQTGRVITYNSGTSTQLEWNESELQEIMLRAVEFMSVSTEDTPLTQYTNAKTKGIN